MLALSLVGLWQGHDVVRGVYHLVRGPDVEIVESRANLPVVDQHRVSWLADLSDPEINESSGLAASNHSNDFVWTINDSGSEPVLFAVNLQGETLARVAVTGAENIDWEALSSFVLDGTPYLAIGDVGDNFNWRRSVSVYLVPEPVIDTNSQGVSQLSVEVAWQVQFTYPEGGLDSEAMAVDAVSAKILVLSKRERPNWLYTVPLMPAGEASVMVAEPLQALEALPSPTEEEMDIHEALEEFLHLPSGMSVQQNSLLITTYKDAYLYTLQRSATGKIEALTDLVSIPLPSLGQREAITFARDSNIEAYISKESMTAGRPADLFELKFSPDDD